MKYLYSFVLIALLAGGMPALAQQYRVIDVSPAASSLVMEGIGGGQQVGMGVYPGQPMTGNRAVMWSGTASSMVDLTPPFHSYGQAKAVANGIQVGTVATTFQQLPQDQTVADYRATLWRGSAASFVSLHPAGYAVSFANCTTGAEHGGYAKVHTASTDPAHAILWTGNTAATAVDLDPWGLNSMVNGCAPGVQVGTARSHAAMWHGSATSYVDLHPQFSFTSSIANGVAAEQTVGWADGWRALLWTDADNLNVINLHPAAAFSSYAWATNGQQQVGFVEYNTASGSVRMAMRWSGSAQSAVNLHQFLPANYLYSEAFDIDENGNIAGVAIDASGYHSVIWAPMTATTSASVRVSPEVLVGSQTVDVTVRLTSPAPAEGATVQLSTTTPAVIMLPASVFVPAGQSTATFQAATATVGFPTRILITASYANINRMASLSIEPAVLPQSLQVAPDAVRPGVAATGTITVTRPAPIGGAAISIFSSDPNVTVPAVVQIPEGQQSATFPVQSSAAITTSTWVSITAQASGVFVYSSLYVAVPDQVQILKAQYVPSKRELQIDATSTSAGAVITVFIDGRSLGTLPSVGGGKYKGVFSMNTAPQNVLLQSDQGGSAAAAIRQK